jgi:hypothetical protein
MEKTLRDGLLPKLMADNPDLHAVIGLEAARLLAARLMQTLDERPLAESDIRSLHALVTAGRDYSGLYKRFHVQIGGNTEHEPVLPIEVSLNMRELVTWHRSCPPENPILHAAALHAWLTHIHPFEDGNGRVARLLANMTLAGAGLPPAIVKAKTQRTAYLDALATSDEGGDIMPLTGLFAKTLSRFAADMQKPRFFRKLFNDLVTSRGNSEYDAFMAEMDMFLRFLSAELSAYRLTSTSWDQLDVEAFGQYKKAQNYEATTVLMIENDTGAQVAVQVAPSTQAMGRYQHSMRRRADYGEVERLPSLQFALRGERYALEAYPLADPYRLFGLREVAFDLEAGSRAYVLIAGDIRRGSSADVAEVVAAAIGRGFSAGRVTAAPERGRRAPLPRLNGGPG